jgi:hypothetical protein
MEALQILKYSVKSLRLSFLNDLVAQEHDYTLEGGVTDAAFNELYDAGKFTELDELLVNSELSSA